MGFSNVVLLLTSYLLFTAPNSLIGASIPACIACSRFDRFTTDQVTLSLDATQCTKMNFESWIECKGVTLGNEFDPVGCDVDLCDGLITKKNKCSDWSTVSLTVDKGSQIVHLEMSGDRLGSSNVVNIDIEKSCMLEPVVEQKDCVTDIECQQLPGFDQSCSEGLCYEGRCYYIPKVKGTPCWESHGICDGLSLNCPRHVVKASHGEVCSNKVRQPRKFMKHQLKKCEF